MRFEGKSVVVTGAGSGIGRKTALLFAAEGARVLAADINDTVKDTAALHSSISLFQGDAGCKGDVVGMIEKAVSYHGGLDVIAANAGISGGVAGLDDQDEEDWAQVLRVNLIGAFLAVKYGSRAMRDAGTKGAIVCTASVAGLRAGAGGPAYSASKAGVINLVQIAAQELAGTGIRVNAVCPGLIETSMTLPIYASARERGREDKIGQLNPLRRGGEPEEIAQAIAFLASEQAGYVNGHALIVDGGLATSHPFVPARRG
ncbi:SDR family NAD(P)-dependent oxidoreductase [Bradyrhizobium sp. CCBAU 51753]|uniref:SDR family NAD(P)-dependent oxidoreductase n=1 Tax=Bradyrhizobium sp. CCBAU 51753 TaxID=1325100 RepID=UPI00188D9DAF|nr:SDR family NAD(P)-dependent oxidoreductase [Bradyrhizobium sp. CCBAU 51753]QOZ23897.1 oxidoreductase [Bradyrhizobium sp. CCBAU 51753]